MQCLNHFNGGVIVARLHKFGINLSGIRPIPSVREGMKLRLARLAGIFAEQHIVISIGIERRVEINEINTGIGKNLFIPQPFQIVTKKQFVHAGIDNTNAAQTALFFPQQVKTPANHKGAALHGKVLSAICLYLQAF